MNEGWLWTLIYSFMEQLGVVLCWTLCFQCYVLCRIIKSGKLQFGALWIAGAEVYCYSRN